MSDALDDLPEGGLPDEFRRGVAFAELCRRQAEQDHAWAMRRRGLDPVAALDRLDAAVSALAAERDALREGVWAIAEQAFSFRGHSFRYTDVAADPSIVWHELQAARAEMDALRDRVARAVAELDAVVPGRPGQRRAGAVVTANLRAWDVLTEGRYPPSARRAEHAPGDAGENGA